MPISHGGLEGVRELPAMGAPQVGAGAACADLGFSGKNSEIRPEMLRKLLIMKINLLKNNDFLRSDPQLTPNNPPITRLTFSN